MGSEYLDHCFGGDKDGGVVMYTYAQVGLFWKVYVRVSGRQEGR